RIGALIARLDKIFGIPLSVSLVTERPSIARCHLCVTLELHKQLVTFHSSNSTWVMDALTISPEWFFNMALRTARVWQVILFMCVCCCSIGVQAMTCSVTQPNGNTPPGEQPEDKTYDNGKTWPAQWWTKGHSN